MLFESTWIEILIKLIELSNVLRTLDFIMTI